MVSLADFTGRMDTTKIRVTDGDVPAGDWIFNGHAMVFVPKDQQNSNDDKNKKEVEKIIVPLSGKIRLIPRKAEEFGPLRQFASDMSPLAGTIAGVTLLSGFFGAMTGFAAGQMVGRNVATFTCELEDGRKFNALADYRVFQRLQKLARTN